MDGRGPLPEHFLVHAWRLAGDVLEEEDVHRDLIVANGRWACARILDQWTIRTSQLAWRETA